jgi:hypothetical protein
MKAANPFMAELRTVLTAPEDLDTWTVAVGCKC